MNMCFWLEKLKNKGIEHFLFVGATILSAGIHFVYSIYVKAYILPLEYGMYSTCMLLQTYLAYLQLGSLNAFNRDYPQLVGAKKDTEARNYRNTVFSFLLCIYALSILIIAVTINIIGKQNGMDTRMVLGFILAAVLTGVTIVENFGNYRCRIDRGFKYSSIVTLLELLSIPLGIILIPRMGYYAIYLTAIIAMIIGIIFYFKPSYKDIKLSFDWKLLKVVLISGSPLLINGLIWTVVNSIDKFVILGYIDTEALGVYGIAQNAFSYMVLIPSAMSQMFYVQMGKKYGETGEKETLLNVSNNYAIVLAAVTSFIAVVAFFLLPLMVETFMPNYANGVPAAQILILGLSIYAATLINGNILTILKENKALLINSICMCVFNAVCSVALVYILGAKIESVALGTALSYTFCAFIIIYQVNKYAKYSIIKLLMASVIPVVITLIPSVILYYCINNKIIGLILSVLIILAFYVMLIKKKVGINLFAGGNR